MDLENSTGVKCSFHHFISGIQDINMIITDFNSDHLVNIVSAMSLHHSYYFSLSRALLFESHQVHPTLKVEGERKIKLYFPRRSIYIPILFWKYSVRKIHFSFPLFIQSFILYQYRLIIQYYVILLLELLYL